MLTGQASPRSLDWQPPHRIPAVKNGHRLRARYWEEIQGAWNLGRKDAEVAKILQWRVDRSTENLENKNN